ncbi:MULTISPECIES: hypothetical protein [Comamonas]|uniref:hypothetical protein n=1 Tax=Comamonas TaxID=283 RepID=UPI0012C2BAD9|nr:MULTISPECIES: hypothetical protein [Comamonas]MDR3067857.1 hypothetical protein [Comamonas sp.]MEB5966964.1 hypothetical protein [Comamonas testosteroni]MPS95600.1 hypothetical protein [Comamonas sp.]
MKNLLDFISAALSGGHCRTDGFGKAFCTDVHGRFIVRGQAPCAGRCFVAAVGGNVDDLGIAP